MIATTFIKNYTGGALTSFCLLLFPLSLSFAECPPDCSSRQFSIQSMSLSYNSTTRILHVEADHHSRDQENREVDYVDKMTVSVNGDEIIVLHFKHQRDPDRFYDDTMFKAKSGDVISVELFSFGGSNKSLDLTVSDGEISETQNVATQESEATY